MKLYHGTSASVARGALSFGIQTREDSGVESLWEECPSRADIVYLTSAYAPYFGLHAAAAAGEKELGLVEVELDDLWEPALVPDEDFVEQATSQSGAPANPEGSMEERTKYFRDHIEDYARTTGGPHWIDSGRSGAWGASTGRTCLV